jgi:ribose 5-phosphate isomerase A
VHRIVEVQAKQFIVIVDASKMADGIGPHFDLPVEIIKFCSEHVRYIYAHIHSTINYCFVSCVQSCAH